MPHEIDEDSEESSSNDRLVKSLLDMRMIVTVNQGQSYCIMLRQSSAFEIKLFPPGTIATKSWLSARNIVLTGRGVSKAKNELLEKVSKPGPFEGFDFFIIPPLPVAISGSGGASRIRVDEEDDKGEDCWFVYKFPFLVESETIE